MIRDFLLEKDGSRRLSSSRLLMLLGGLLFAVLTLTFGGWSLFLAIPKLLTGAWGTDAPVVVLAVLDGYRWGVTLAAALAAPYIAKNFGGKFTIRRTAPDTSKPEPSSHDGEPLAG